MCGGWVGLDFGFRIWDLDLGLGFGTWIWDLDLGLGFGIGLGFDKNPKLHHAISLHHTC